MSLCTEQQKKITIDLKFRLANRYT
jgi:hypothetical protein